MLSSIIRRSITRTTLRRFYVSLAGNNYALVTNQCRSKDSMLQCLTSKNNAVPHRYFWYKKNNLTKCLPLLPGHVDKSITWTTIISTLMNDVVTIRLLDEDFNIKEIVNCIKTVACNVSIELADRNYDYLVGLIDEDTLTSLQEKIDSLTEAQRSLIAIREENIIRYGLTNIRSHEPVFSEDTSNDSQLTSIKVEVRVLFLYKPDYGEIEHREREDNDIFGNLKLPDKLVANYVFSRVYAKNKNTDWVITYINIDTPGIFSGLD